MLLEAQQAEWSRHRARLEREVRVLVVDGDPALRKVLDDLLYRCRIPSRSVGSAELALELAGREHYALVIAADQLPGMTGLALTRQLRVNYPQLDVILTAHAPSVDLVTHAFDLRLLDLLPVPLDSAERVMERLKLAVGRNVDRRMQTYVLNELRNTLEELDPEVRLRTTTELDRRLSAFKDSLGAFDRVLVVEANRDDLRILSENLLLAGFHVETVDAFEEALTRVAGQDVCLVVAMAEAVPDDMVELQRRLRAVDPRGELAVASLHAQPEIALRALRDGLAYYLAWPPASASMLVLRIRDILRRGRRERLVENLFLELYRETYLAHQPNLSPDHFSDFCTLIGLQRAKAMTVEALRSPLGDDDLAEYVADATTGDYLDDVLSDVVVHVAEETPADASATSATEDGSERRVHLRIPESHFVRFRPKASPAATLAYMGDLSQGGLFIRTPELLTPGTLMEVDFRLEHDGQGYVVRCRAQVAWVARNDRQSTLGPGLGIKFLAPPDDVRALLSTVIEHRTGEFQAVEGSEAGGEPPDESPLQ
ncbi:MAG: response regulator [Deltaproteobacteria bacterium]|nr:response regulator [Deltaproteobacteria bacterium]